jgi:mannose-6-phosphate isomerase-like protein (cupin superfamily)
MFQADLKKLTKENDNFRKVIYTGEWSQLVLMSIPPGGEIGRETHRSTDQLLFLVEGEGEAILDEQTTKFKEHGVVFVPAGTRHNFKNTGDEDLKLYTVYAPPAHPDGTVHKTKADADLDEGDDEYQKAEVSAHDIYENM